MLRLVVARIYAERHIMHPQAYQFVKSVIEGIQYKDNVLEFGSRDVNGNTRELFPSWTEWTGMDLVAGPNVTRVGDAADHISEYVRKFDVVVCTEVLEHTSLGSHICSNAFDYLKKGGVFIVTAAGEGRIPHSAVDGCQLRDGEYYGNVTEEMLREWMRHFSVVIVMHNTEHHDIYAAGVV